jgi:hopanoid biosynthesis associated RND transporter like protein HpnN
MNLVGRVLRAVVRLCCRHPLSTVVAGIGLAVLSLWVTSARLSFEASQLHLLPPSQPYVTRYRDYSKDFGELDEIIIAVRGPTLRESQAFASRLVRELRAGPIVFNHLAYRVALDDFGGPTLMYLPTAALRELRDQVFDHQEFIESFVAAPGLVRLLEGANRQFAGAFASHFLDLGLQDGAVAADLRFLTTLVTQMREAISHPALEKSPWGAMLPVAEGGEDAGYFVSDDKQLLFLLADPVGGSGGFTNDGAAIDEIRARIAGLRVEFPGVQAGVTGGPALSNDEMRTAFQDSQLATGLAFALTLGLLVLAFRRLREPLVMLAVLGLSLVWSLGLITVTVGHLTVFSVMFISIVVGLGIDYGIYVLFRWDEEVMLGSGPVAALDLMATRTGPGILLGALTAAATFYVLTVTDFHGVQELGFIAGTALITSFVAMLTVFPALLVLIPRRSPARPPSPIDHAGARDRAGVPFVEFLTRHPTAVLVGTGILTALSLWSTQMIGFDYNLLHLQANGTEAVVWERHIIDTQSRSSFAGLSSATSLAELERKVEAFKRLPSVAGVDSALLFIPDDQPAKSKVIRDIGPLIAPLRVGPTPRLDLSSLTAALKALERRVGLAVGEAGAGGPSLELRAIRIGLADVLRQLRTEDPVRALAGLTLYQTRVVRDFGEKLRLLQRNLEHRSVTFDDVPAELRRKFISESGRFLLQIHPKVDVWDRDGAIRFVHELRSVDADVTGTPVISYESIRRMEDAYRRGALYAFVLVAIISWIMIRRVRETMLALTPLVLGTLWAIGLMHLFGLKLNLANVWGVPLIIGASAEYGLNVVTRVMEARTFGGPFFARSTILAVAFNGLSTITGFGSLLVAHHRGIWSLGLLLTCGSLTSLVAALVVLPVLIHLQFGRDRRPGTAPS